MDKQIIGVMLSIALLAGCATDRGQTQAEGTGAGAVIGALTGAAVGALAGGKKGAIIGAAAGAGVGAGAGYAYGNHVANQKEKFAREEDYLDAVINSAQQMNEQTQQYNASLRSEVNTLDRETALLVRQYNQRAITRGELQKEEQRLATKISEAQKQLQRLGKEMEIQRGVLAKEQGQSQEHLKKLQMEVAELERQKTELEQHINRLASIKTRVAV
ncbi:MAG: hypothetical protein ACJ788_01020 [Ktedonobacteraceae bacterium]